MASPTRWTWVWVNSGSWWWTGRPGVLRFMGLQRVGHDWETEMNWTELVQFGIYVRNLARDWKFTIRSGSKRRCQEVIGTQKGSAILGMDALTIHQSRIHSIKWRKSLGLNLEELQYLKTKRRRRIRNWKETKKCRRETQKIREFWSQRHTKCLKKQITVNCEKAYHRSTRTQKCPMDSATERAFGFKEWWEQNPDWNVFRVK